MKKHEMIEMYEQSAVEFKHYLEDALLTEDEAFIKNADDIFIYDVKHIANYRANAGLTGYYVFESIEDADANIICSSDIEWEDPDVSDYEQIDIEVIVSNLGILPVEERNMDEYCNSNKENEIECSYNKEEDKDEVEGKITIEVSAEEMSFLSLLRSTYNK